MEIQFYGGYRDGETLTINDDVEEFQYHRHIEGQDSPDGKRRVETYVYKKWKHTSLVFNQGNAFEVLFLHTHTRISYEAPPHNGPTDSRYDPI